MWRVDPFTSTIQSTPYNMCALQCILSFIIYMAAGIIIAQRKIVAFAIDETTNPGCPLSFPVWFGARPS